MLAGQYSIFECTYSIGTHILPKAVLKEKERSFFRLLGKNNFLDRFKTCNSRETEDPSTCKLTLRTLAVSANGVRPSSLLTTQPFRNSRTGPSSVPSCRVARSVFISQNIGCNLLGLLSQAVCLEAAWKQNRSPFKLLSRTSPRKLGSAGKRPQCCVEFAPFFFLEQVS